MKQVTLNIPESKYKFFLELIRHLGFDEPKDSGIPEEHKAIVVDRIKKSKQDELIPWQEARKKLRFKK
ncbi:MAG: hypothetical protein RIG77_24915 [Cyclobacteriaceae bacterium]